MTFAITKSHFTTFDYNKIDRRFYPYLDDWKVVEYYKGRHVTIPGTWNAEIFVCNYYEVIKIATDPNSNEDENEKEVTLACGWRDKLDGMFDREVQINLRISGRDVLSNSCRVSAEIMKCGGAPMEVFFDNQLITDFHDKVWWSKNPNGYQTISDMQDYL